MRPTALVAGCLLLGACASGGATAGDPPTPAPRPGTPAPAAPSGGRGPAVGFRPVSAAGFRIERHDSLMLQYPGGASQEQMRDRVAFVRLTLTEASVPGEYRVDIVLDSLHAWENGMPVPPDSTGAVSGARWTATLTDTGELQGLQSDREGILVDELARGIHLLFPALPPGGVREGMEWTDTTEYRLVADAFPGQETVVNTYRASEAEGGGDVLVLESDGSYTRSGTRVQAEQELQMTATGTRKGSHRLAHEGTLISAEGTEAGEMTISVPALGQTVPVKQSGSYSITATGSR